MLKSRRFRTTDMAYQRLQAQEKIFDLYDEVEILKEDIEILQEHKNDIVDTKKSKEEYEKGKTHDVCDVTIRVTYPREVFRTPNEWDWDVIVTGIYPAIEAKMISWTVPHRAAPTW
jgi:hypothetical protein